MDANKQHLIGREKAKALSRSNWWINQPPREIAKFQLFTKELCMPFDVFHQSVATALGRSAMVHELVMNFDAIVQELYGERDTPTLDEILDLIPKKKRSIIQI